MPSINSTISKRPYFSEAEILHAGFSSNQTSGFSLGDYLRFNTVRLSYGGITLGSYQFTLPANGIYKLKASFSTSGGGLFANWYNVTTATDILGSNLANYYATANTNQPTATATVQTGSTPVVVAVVINGIAPGLTAIHAYSAYAVIEKIASHVPIQYLTDYWDDLCFPATAINPPGIASDPTFDTTNIGWAFSASATNLLFLIAQLPHSYKEGSDLKAHIHWEPSNTNTGNVLWRLSYRWRNDGETAAALTNVDILVPAGGTALTLQVNGFAAISKPNALISSMLDMTLTRLGADGTDTFTGTAILKEFDIHYLKDSSGSVSEYSK